MWLRMMPQFDPEKRWLGTELRSLATGGYPRLFGSEAFSSYSANHVFFNDGFGTYMCDQPTPYVAYIFKTGEVWAIDAYHLAVQNVIYRGLRELRRFYS
jgi:hypothetical protein